MRKWRAGGDGRPVSFPRVPWHESVEDKADRELERAEKEHPCGQHGCGPTYRAQQVRGRDDV